MKFEEFKTKIASGIFSSSDITKVFPEEDSSLVKTQIYRWVKKGYIVRIKKGLYSFKGKNINSYYLANLLYQPSYISLETALFFYGIIPDVSQSITSVTPITKKEFKTAYGRFFYHKIAKDLYFGFYKEKIGEKYVQIATKEKALLDFLYLRKIKRLDDLRIDFSKINLSQCKKLSKSFPSWVEKIL